MLSTQQIVFVSEMVHSHDSARDFKFGFLPLSQHMMGVVGGTKIVKPRKYFRKYDLCTQVVEYSTDIQADKGSKMMKCSIFYFKRDQK